MIVSDKYKIIFLHIPRTSGTSMYDFFSKLDPSVKKYDKYRDEDYSFGHLPASKIRDIVGEDKWKQYFKFSFIRNPFYWAKSFYLHDSSLLYSYDEEIWESIWWIFKDKTEGFAIDNNEIKLNNFLKWHTFREWWIHPRGMINQSDYLDIPIDYIGIYEDLDNELKYIGKKIGIDINLPMINKNKNNSVYFSNEVMEIIPTVFKDDIELWDKTKKINSCTYKGIKELRIPFKNSKSIEKNYSGAYQDLFILQCFNGKRNGTFLEIGAGDPTWGSNTYLLCDKFGWTGTSQDYDFNEWSHVVHNKVKYTQKEFIPVAINEWNEIRNNPLILEDALKTDYVKLLEEGQLSKVIDYLQLDIDPAHQTYELLERIPFDVIDFKVITYEHDAYCEGPTWRNKSREFLKSKGFILVAGNIATENASEDELPFEDWWVNSKYKNEINSTIMKNAKKFNNSDSLPVKQYIFK